MQDRLSGKEVLLRKLLVLIPFVLLGGLILVQSRAMRSEVLAAGTEKLEDRDEDLYLYKYKLALNIERNLFRERLSCLEAHSFKDCVTPLKWGVDRKVDPITDKVDLTVYAVGRLLESRLRPSAPMSADHGEFSAFPLLILTRCYDVVLYLPMRTGESLYTGRVASPVQYRIDRKTPVETQGAAVSVTNSAVPGKVWEMLHIEGSEARELLKRLRLGKALHLRFGENLMFFSLDGADQAVGEFLEHCAPVTLPLRPRGKDFPPPPDNVDPLDDPGAGLTTGRGISDIKEEV